MELLLLLFMLNGKLAMLLQSGGSDGGGMELLW